MDKEKIKSILTKQLDNKNILREYLKGNISKNELSLSGIKLGKPI